GAAATFDVAADGSEPMTFQWRKNGIAISGQTTTSLVLPAVHQSDAGDYDVTISNPAGDVVSVPASLVISTPPTLSSMLTLNNGSAQFTLTGTPGDQYTIEFSTDLVNWTDAAKLTNIIGTVQFTDTQASNYLHGFYRCRLSP